MPRKVGIQDERFPGPPATMTPSREGRVCFDQKPDPEILAMIDKIPFGSTGHESSRTIFGAAALGSMRQERADPLLEVLLEYGVNHIDTAASYGDSELRLAPWMRKHRDKFFLASKTGDRTYEGARGSIRRSLERLEVEQLDMIQFHNLVDETEWETAFAPGGALEAAVEARDKGLVRFIGVTGHGSMVAAMHLKSLERFAFDSVLLPYNYAMMGPLSGSSSKTLPGDASSSRQDYAADFNALYDVCRERGVAMQTIKSVARRRWREGDGPRYSWYEPLRDPEALTRAVNFVLGRPGLFLNTSSDATLLRQTLEAASAEVSLPPEPVLAGMAEEQAIEPLFVRGVTDTI
jgi:Aldo/keto reductase family